MILGRYVELKLCGITFTMTDKATQTQTLQKPSCESLDRRLQASKQRVDLLQGRGKLASTMTGTFFFLAHCKHEENNFQQHTECTERTLNPLPVTCGELDTYNQMLLSSQSSHTVVSLNTRVECSCRATAAMNLNLHPEWRGYQNAGAFSNYFGANRATCSNESGTNPKSAVASQLCQCFSPETQDRETKKADDEATYGSMDRHTTTRTGVCQVCAFQWFCDHSWWTRPQACHVLIIFSVSWPRVRCPNCRSVNFTDQMWTVRWRLHGAGLQWGQLITPRALTPM